MDVLNDGWAEKARRIDLSPGESAAVELVPLDRIAGRVIDVRDGRPVPDFELRLMRLTFKGRPHEKALVTQHISRSDGAFDIIGIGLQEGQQSPDQATARDFDHLELRASVPGRVTASLPLASLGPGPIWSGIELRLESAPIWGRVTVTEDEDVAVPDASLLLLPAELTLKDISRNDTGAWIDASANESGRRRRELARVDAETDGWYSIAVNPEQRTAVRVFAWAPGRVATLSEAFELSPDMVPVRMDLALAPGAVIRGSVRIPVDEATSSESGEIEASPIARFSLVHAIPVDDDAIQGSATRTNHALWNDWDSTAWPGEIVEAFRFDGLAPGTWDVTALLEFGSESSASVQARPLSRRLSLVAGEETDIEFLVERPAAGTSLSGRVRLPSEFDFDDGDLLLVQRSGEFSVSSAPPAMGYFDAEGTFEISLADVAPGEYLLVARADDGMHNRVSFGVDPVTVGAGSPSPRDVSLDVPDVRVQLTGAGRRTTLQLTGVTRHSSADALLEAGFVTLFTDGDGAGHFYGLPPGQYVVTSDGDPPRTASFELQAGRGGLHVVIP